MWAALLVVVVVVVLVVILSQGVKDKPPADATEGAGDRRPAAPVPDKARAEIRSLAARMAGKMRTASEWASKVTNPAEARSVLTKVADLMADEETQADVVQTLRTGAQQFDDSQTMALCRKIAESFAAQAAKLQDQAEEVMRRQDGTPQDGTNENSALAQLRSRIRELPAYEYDLSRGFWDIESQRFVTFRANSHIVQLQKIDLEAFLRQHGTHEFQERSFDLVWVGSENRSAKIDKVRCLKAYVKQPGGPPTYQHDIMIMKAKDGSFWYCVERRAV